MSDGTDIAYATGELRGGAEALSAVQRSADLATARLQGAVLTPEMFGRTPAAGGFHGAVTAARGAQARGFRRESERSGDLSGRSSGTADAGDGLTASTTSIAAQPPAGQP